MTSYIISPKDVPFDTLLGKTITKIVGEEGGDEILFVTDNGEEFRMYHEQDCCESVYVESIVGDLNDLIGEKILLAEESTPSVVPPENGYADDSFTWTFYKLATRKGYIDIRWFGTSNGYYSERVDFVQVREATVQPKLNIDFNRGTLYDAIYEVGITTDSQTSAIMNAILDAHKQGMLIKQ